MPVAFPRAIEHSPNAAFLFGQIDGGTKAEGRYADLVEECDVGRNSKKVSGYLILRHQIFCAPTQSTSGYSFR